MSILTLDVVWTTRAAGTGRTKRQFLDFVIDGVPLSSLLNVDFIAPFGWLGAEEEEASIDRLLGKSPRDLLLKPATQEAQNVNSRP